MKNRTDCDFSKHKLIIKETEDLLIHHLKIPGTITHNIKFCNIKNDVLVVTGDYGNWVFCRNFIPSRDEHNVSDGYWIEKLQIKSDQIGKEFSPEETKKEILELLADEYCQDEEDREYLNNLLNYVEYDECEYKNYAYNNLPSNRDWEFIPYVKTTKYWLKVIFDAFDEICRRLYSSNE